jgi:secondary thiamine-phosphate synthase enzyme
MGVRGSFDVRTSSRLEMVDITRQVRDAVASHGAGDGWCTVYVPHTTAGVTINEGADPDVASDILDALERIVPSGGSYRHREGNAAAHVKASLVGSSARVPIEGGRLALGTWQAVFFCEFDGPRSRTVLFEVS